MKSVARKLGSAAVDGFREAWRIARYPSLIMLLVCATFTVCVVSYWLAIE